MIREYRSSNTWMTKVAVGRPEMKGGKSIGTDKGITGGKGGSLLSVSLCI